MTKECKHNNCIIPAGALIKWAPAGYLFNLLPYKMIGMNKLYLYFLLFILAIACQRDPQASFENSKKTGEVREKLFEKVGTLKIPLVSPTMYTTYEFYVRRHKGKPYLFMLDDLMGRNTLVVYDLNQEKIVRQEKLKEEGPNGFQVIEEINFSMIPVSPDSVLFWNASNGVLYECRDSTIPKKHEWPSRHFKPAISSHNPAYQNGNRLLISIATPNLDQPDFTDLAGAVQLTIREDSLVVSRKMFHYPELYNKGIYGLRTTYKYHASICKDQLTWLVSFPIDHRVYRYDHKFRLIDTLFIGSNFVPEAVPFKKRSFFKKLVNKEVPPPSKMERAKYGWTTSDYSKIFKIPQSPYFGRMTSIRPSWEALQKDIRKAPYLMNFSIIVFDAEGQIIGEQVMDEANELNSVHHFVDHRYFYIVDYERTENNEQWMYVDKYAFQPVGKSSEGMSQ